jgi:hypothetical protein
MNDQIHKHINTFFDTYAKALENHDTKLMAWHYHIPCTMLSDDNMTTFTEASKLEGLFNQGVVFYKQFGIVHAHADIWKKDVWTDKIARVTVNWQYMDTQRQPIYNCDYQYVMREVKNGQLKIICSVSVNEKERMNDWMKQKEANKLL